MHEGFRLGVCSVILAVLSGCAQQAYQSTEKGFASLPDLKTLENLQQKEVGILPVSGLRTVALRDLALSLGARSGLASRAEVVNQGLLAKSREFDRVFNFQELLLDNQILPPVLIEARHTLNLADEHSIRVSDRSYKILRQARFVTAPPNWRDYLFMAYPKPEFPDMTLLPNSADERRIWRENVAKGWSRGVEQADQIYQENLARLKRDYEGMIRYRFLLAQKMVSPPHVAHRDLGVTGGGEELSLGDQTLEIMALPSLQPDSKKWEPALRVAQQTPPTERSLVAPVKQPVSAPTSAQDHTHSGWSSILEK